MRRLLYSPRTLQNARRKLGVIRREGEVELDRLMAMAECNFRLAVHRDTPLAESVGLLQEAIRIDGSNPKYAYHLGRTYLLLGDFREAASWLRLACCLSPTNHRVWVHVAILLRELNEVYRGNEDFEPNALYKRAEAILSAVRDGRDNIDANLLDFIPPRSLASKEREARAAEQARLGHHTEHRKQEEPPPDRFAHMRPPEKARRYLHANRCRWSGIDHLYIQQTLESGPIQENVKRMAPALKRLAEIAGTRPGTQAAFVISCVQWLVRGYPVETVRRLTKQYPSTSDCVSRRTLETVCQIFEADSADVPRMLSKAVTQGTLTPVVAALIHHRRMLWHSLAFRSLGTYRAARRLWASQTQGSEPSAGQATDPESQEMVRGLTSRLQRALGTLRQSPLPSLKDDPGEIRGRRGLDLSTCQLQFLAFEEAGRQLEQFREEGFRVLKQGLDVSTQQIKDADTYSQAVADRDAAGQFSQILMETAKTALLRLEQLMQVLAAMAAKDLGDDFGQRQDVCKKRFQGLNNLGNFTKVLKRVDRRLAAAEGLAASTHPPAVEWSALIEGVKQALPSEIEDSDSGDESEMLSPTERISGWLAEASEFQQLLEEFWPRVKELVHQNGQGGLDPEQRRELAEIRSRFDQVLAESEQRVTEIAELRKSGDVPVEAANDLEAAEKAYREALQARGRFNKNFKKIPEPYPALSEDSDKPPASAPEDARPADRPSVVPVHETAAANPESSGASPLEQVVRQTDAEVEAMFARSLQTFAEYPRWIRLMPSFRILERSIRARQAETIYRMGGRREARAIWNQLLRDDRLDIQVLKNIAICDTIEGDIARQAVSWREYLEMLYLFSLLGDDPRLHARTCAEFHRAFGTAFAPAFLSADIDREWSDKVDPAALITFLNSPGRFRNFIDHRLLEYLNTRFEFRSPSLILGIKRIEAKLHTDPAEQVLCQYVADVSGLLPDRVAASFARLASRTIAAAAAECRKHQQLTLQQTPEYPEEEKRQIQLLVRMCDLKLKLVIAFNSHVNMVRNITSLDFLAELSRLDRIPVDLSPGIFSIVAGSLGLDEETLQKLSTILRENIVASLLKYLFAIDDDPAERPIRQRQCELLVRECQRLPEFRDLRKLIDMPAPFFPPEVLQSLEQGPIEPALEHLRRWNDLYPELAGLATLLCDRLIHRKDFDEAEERLERTRTCAFYDPGRRMVHYHLAMLRGRRIQQLIDAEDYQQAVQLTLSAVELDDCQAVLPQNLLQLYLMASSRVGYRYLAKEVEQAVTAWLDRARQRIDSPEDPDDPLPRPTLADHEAVAKALSETMEKSLAY